MDDWSLVRTLDGHTDIVKKIEILKNDDIVSGSSDSTIRIWDSQTGSTKKILKHANKVITLIILKDGNILSSSYDYCVYSWDTLSGNMMYKFKYPHYYSYIAEINDGQIAVVTWYDLDHRVNSALQIWNFKNRTHVHEFSYSGLGISCILIIDNSHIISGQHLWLAMIIHKDYRVFNVSILDIRSTVDLAYLPNYGLIHATPYDILVHNIKDRIES